MFKVMTFNIRGSFHADGDNVWENRAQLNVETILKASPDIIGFQEFTPGNQAYYDDKLTDYKFCLGPRVSMENDKGRWEHPAIYWRPECFDLLDSGYYYLNETPERYGLSWGTNQGRGLTWVLLHDRMHNVEFVFMNTHFDHISQEARSKSAQLVCQRALEMFPTQPLILTGDFNTTPQSVDGQSSDILTTPYDVFMQAAYKDALDSNILSSSEPTSTFHNFQGDQFNLPDFRIDWILFFDVANRLIAEDSEIIRDAAPPIYPSDHYPVVATFR